MLSEQYCDGVIDTLSEKRHACTTVRNLSPETHRALRAMAAQHGHSTEAYIRTILENAVRPEARIKLGTLLADIGRKVGGITLDIGRDKTPSVPASFE